MQNTNYVPPRTYERILIEDAKEFLKDTGDPDFQVAFDELCRFVALQFPPRAGLGIDGARELVAALFVKGML